MSNRLSRARKGDKKPVIRQDEFFKSIREMDDKLQRVHYLSLYHLRNIENRFNLFVDYLIKKDLIKEKDYKEYLEEVNTKMKLAEDIAKDESLSREEKIKKAKEKDIPEEWVVEKEVPQDQVTEETSSENVSEQSPAAESA